MSDSTQYERTRFGSSSRILREGNMEMFLPIASKEEVLAETASSGSIGDTNRKAIVDLFQSTALEANLTRDIIRDLENFTTLTERRKLAKHFKIVYTHSGKKVRKSPLLLDKSNTKYGIYTSKNSDKENYRIEDLCQGFESAKKLLGGKVDEFNFVNRESEPSKQNPHFSAIMIDNPDVRVGLKNTLEMSAFLNSITTLEFSRAYPYFNALFVLPNKVNKNQSKTFRTASMNQFLFGGSVTGEKASVLAREFESKTIKRRRKFNRDGTKLVEGEVLLEGVEANMSLFTSPQTMINANEKKGHFDTIKAVVGESYDRAATPRDNMLPFMTLKSFDIDVAPTRGFMSFKTGKLAITLHDKNRMIDIAPLIKPDLFGAFGAEILIEYGWTHPDVELLQTNNKIGEFINSSRSIEKYMIVNSSFTIDNNGMVNIDLALAAKGPIMFKMLEIIKTPEYAQFSAVSEKINKKIAEDIAGIQAAIPGSGGTDQIQLSTSRKLETETVSYLDISDNSETIVSGKNKKMPEDLLGQMSEFIARNEDLAGHNFLFTTDGEFSPGSPVDNLLTNFGFNIKTSPFPPASHQHISNLRHNVLQLCNLYSRVIEEQKVMEDHTNLFLNSIIGGSIKEDPYWNKELAKELKIQEVKTAGSIELPDHITLGSILSAIIGNYFLNGVNNSVDEVQLLFYTANKHSGRMRRRNLASLLIPTEDLNKLLEDLSSKPNSLVTVESLIAKILKSIVQKKNNISYGLKDIQDEIKKTQSSKMEDERKKSTTESLMSIQKDRLKDIYPSDEEDLKFVIPNILFIFDSLTNQRGNGKDTTICRITIYDRHDNPFESISTIVQKATGYGKLMDKNKKIVKLKRAVNKNQLTLDEFEERENKIKIELVKEGILVKEGKDYAFSKKTKFDNIKRFIRSYMPYTKIGTQNSGIINASLTTINESKLMTTYVSRPDRNNELIETRVRTDLPLRVMPSQVQVEMFGCPWAQFGQMLFLDFGTETSVDNQYNVTGIQHKFAPGKFTTSLKLSYGDFYGPVESATNNITDLINKKLLKKLEERKLKNQFEYVPPTSVLMSNPGSSTGASIDAAYADLIADPDRLKIAVEKAGFEYLPLDSGASDLSGNPLRNKYPVITESFVNPFVVLTNDNKSDAKKVKVFEQGQSDRSFYAKSKLKEERNLVKFKYRGADKICTSDTLVKLVELLLKYYLVLGYTKKVGITDNFRETYSNGDVPGPSNGHRLGLAFDVLTNSFYSKRGERPYQKKDLNYIEVDDMGQYRMNVFFGIAKSVGFRNFGIGGGVLHIDTRTDRNALWIYTYNQSPSGKKQKNSKVLANGAKEIPLNMWNSEAGISDKFKGNWKSWVKEIWNPHKHNLGQTGYGKGGYDYLPYEYKKQAKIDNTIDKDFNIKNVKTNISLSTPDNPIRTSGFNSLFNVKLKLSYSDIMKNFVEVFEQENKETFLEFANDFLQKENFLKDSIFNPMGLKTVHKFIDHTYNVSHNCMTENSKLNKEKKPQGVISRSDNETNLANYIVDNFTKNDKEILEAAGGLTQYYDNILSVNNIDWNDFSFFLNEDSGGIFTKLNKEAEMNFVINYEFFFAIKFTKGDIIEHVRYKHTSPIYPKLRLECTNLGNKEIILDFIHFDEFVDYNDAGGIGLEMNILRKEYDIKNWEKDSENELKKRKEDPDDPIMTYLEFVNDLFRESHGAVGIKIPDWFPENQTGMTIRDLKGVSLSNVLINITTNHTDKKYKFIFEKGYKVPDEDVENLKSNFGGFEFNRVLEDGKTDFDATDFALNFRVNTEILEKITNDAFKKAFFDVKIVK